MVALATMTLLGVARTQYLLVGVTQVQWVRLAQNPGDRQRNTAIVGVFARPPILEMHEAQCRCLTRRFIILIHKSGPGNLHEFQAIPRLGGHPQPLFNSNDQSLSGEHLQRCFDCLSSECRLTVIGCNQAPIQ